MDETYRLSSGICTADLDRGGILTALDDDFFRLTGYSLDYVMERELTIFSLFDKIYRERTDEALNSSAAEGRAFCLRQPMVACDGRIMLVQCSGIVKDRRSAEIVVSNCNYDDRSSDEQRRLIRELSDQREKLRMIVENTDDVYYDYDVQRDVIHLELSITRFRLDYDNSLENFLGSRAAGQGSLFCRMGQGA